MDTKQWARLIQSIPSHLISLIYILKFSSYLCPVLASGLFTSGFPTKLSMHFWANLVTLDLITRTKFSDFYKPWSSSLCTFLQSLATFSHLGPNTFLSTVLQKTLRLSLPLIWQTNFHTYIKQTKIIILYTFIWFH